MFTHRQSRAFVIAAIAMMIAGIIVFTLSCEETRHLSVDTQKADGVWRAYFDRGKGFSEKNAVDFLVKHGNGKIAIPPSEFTLRLDPPLSCPEPVISKIKLNGEGLSFPLKTTAVNQLTIRQEGDAASETRGMALQIESHATDPYVILDFRVPPASASYLTNPTGLLAGTLLFFCGMIIISVRHGRKVGIFASNLWQKWSVRRGFWMSLLAALLLIRCTDRLWHAVIWAEDGNVFLYEAITFGIKSIFMPYAGYFHTMPRIIAYAASCLPAVMMPHFIVFSAVGIALYVLSTILRGDYEWLVPDIRHRGMLALIFAIAPGTNEIIGNIAGLHWLLYLYMGLLCLRPLGKRLRVQDLLCCILVVLTEGAVITLLPLLFIRLVSHVIKKRNRFLICQELFLAGLILLVSVVNFSIRTEQSSLSVNVPLMIEVASKTLLVDIIAYPWLNFLPYTLDYPGWLCITLGPGIVSVCALWRRWSAAHWAVMFFLAAIVAFVLMTVMARAGSANIFLKHFSDATQWANFRYSFLPAAGSYVFWIWLIDNYFKKHKATTHAMTVTLGLLACAFFISTNRFPIKVGLGDNKWIQNAAAIDNIIKNPEGPGIIIPIEPAGWVVHLGGKTD